MLLRVILCAALLLVPGAAAYAAPDDERHAVREQALAGVSVAYPAGASASRAVGKAFDTCTAPSLAAMRAWEASPYRSIGVYVGGPNRACGQPNLTAAWAQAVARRGWTLLPVYVGLQAPCADRQTLRRIDPRQASAQGTASARDAVARMSALGLLRGSIVYADMENYRSTDAACRVAVLQYLTGWTRELHRQGFLSGVYGNLGSAVAHLSGAYRSGTFLRPDAVWLAHWDGVARIDGWRGITNAHWSLRQRVKQYRGDHWETHGGVRLLVDSNQVDAPAATVVFAQRTTARLTLRAGPSAAAASRGVLANGATARVVCQTAGSRVGRTSVWDKLTDGSYVSDAYVNTPSGTGFSAPIPRCTYPWQVTAGSGVVTRAGPGVAARRTGSLPLGTLAWVDCQRSGSLVDRTQVWDRVDSGAWLTDRYVASPGRNAFSPPVARC